MKELYEPWRWRHFTAASGLPAEHLEDLVEGRDGTIWVRTQDEIAWFDAYLWSTVRRGDGKPIGTIHCMRGDGRDGVFVLTGRDVLKCRFDGCSQYLDYPLQDLVALGSESLLVLSDGELSVMAVASKEKRLGFSQEKIGRVSRMFPTPGGTAWLATTQGLYSFDQDEPKLRLRANARTFSIAALTEDRQGRGMAVVLDPESQRGLWEWDRGGKIARHPSERAAYAKTLAMKPDGFALALLESGRVRTRTKGRWHSLDPLPERMLSAHFIHARPNGDLWVGTDDGLFLYDASPGIFTYETFGDLELLDRINAIMRARDGSLWLGTSNGVLCISPAGERALTRRIGGTDLGLVTGLAEDRQGHIWISSGSHFSGAFRFDGRAWRHIGAQEGLPAPRIHRIKRDAKGNLWFLGLGDQRFENSREPGAFMYDGAKFVKWGPEQGLLSGRVYDFAEAADGTLWFGTSGGLSKWTGGGWTHWTVKNGLRHALIFTIAPDQADRLWFGDRMSGLGVIDAHGAPTYYTTADGLANNEVREIALDPDGRLWISTYGGLSSFDGQRWGLFDSKAGLVNSRLWPLLIERDRIYLGTNGAGLAVLDLKKSGTPLPKVFFERPIVEENNVVIRWHAASYWGRMDPGDIMTRYRLAAGEWTSWNKTRSLEVSDLAAGNYTCTVQAKDFFGNYEPDGFTVSFEVAVPIVQRPVFFVPILGLSIALMVLGASYLIRKRRHQRSLEESRQRLRTVVNRAPVVLFSTDQRDSITFLEGRGLWVPGIESSEWAGRSIEELLGGQPGAAKLIQDTWADGHSLASFVIHERNLDIHTSLLRDDAGGPGGIIGVAIDVTDQIEAEKRQHRTERRYQQLFSSANDAIVLIEPENEIVIEANQKACELYGFTRAELLGSSLRTLTRDVERGEAAIRDLLKAGQLENHESVHFRKDGSSIDVSINASSVDHDERRAVLCIIRDVTDRKRAETSLRESEEKYRRLFEEDLTGNFLATADGRIIDCNPSFAEIYGYPSLREARRSDFGILFPHPEERSRILETLQAGTKLANYESTTRRLDGSDLHTIQNIVPLQNPDGRVTLIQGYVFDNSQRHVLQQQLIQAQKMQSLGTLAGGIAHDFNNILGIILGYASMLLEDCSGQLKHPGALEAIVGAAHRGAGMVRQILTFARKTKVEMGHVDLNSVVEEFAKLTRETFPKTLCWDLKLDPSLPGILGDTTQLQQAVLNLCVNARDAMDGRGVIGITTQSVAGCEVRQRNPQATADRYLCLAVSDNGIGIEEERLALIFEPFYTTKAVGQGTGLGLAVVYGIVTTHKGIIEVDSRIGSGTTFRLYFPAIGSRTEEEPISTAARTAGGTETILVVEDEPMLQNMLKMMLERAGYSVIQAMDGDEALGKFEENRGDIGAVICDIGLPGMGGFEAISRMREIDPSIRVVVCSGYVKPEFAQQMSRAGITRILRKPYKPAEILDSLREVLDSGANSAP